MCLASSILTRPRNAVAMNYAVKVKDVMRALISLIRCLFIYCVIMGINQSVATVYPRPAVDSNVPPTRVWHGADEEATTNMAGTTVPHSHASHR